jgi:hypothetical protein
MSKSYKSVLLRTVTVAQLAVLVTLWPAGDAAASARPGKTTKLQKILNELKNLNEVDRRKVLAQLDGNKPAAPGKGATRQAATTPSPNPTVAGSAPQKPVIPSTPPKSWIDKELEAYPGFSLAVAKDFTDISVLQFVNASNPNSPKPTGATISYSDDRSAKDSSLTLQAVGIVGYKFLDLSNATTHVGLNYLEVGAYGGANKFTNSNPVSPKTKTADNVIYGGYLNLEDGFSEHFYNYFRIKAGAVTNDIAQKTLFGTGKKAVTTTQTASQFSGSFEWFPVINFVEEFRPDEYLGFYGNMTRGTLFGGATPFIHIDPEIAFHYDNSFDSTNPLLFSNKSTATRLGPQIGVVVRPFIGLFNENLNSISLKANYYWWHEFEAGHNSYTFRSALNYDLPWAGIGKLSGVALSIGYQRGANVDTGQNMGLFTVGLSGTLCLQCSSDSSISKGGGG